MAEPADPPPPGAPLALLARQAAWQRGLAELSWPEKVRWAAAVRESVKRLHDGASQPRSAALAGAGPAVSDPDP